MERATRIEEVRRRLDPERNAGRRIGFVPTMGNLHAGHLALVARARAECDLVVASVYVNPLQFGANEDFDRYPRTLEADAAQLTEAGCDLLFCPRDEEMYPNGLAEQTRVVPTALADVLCGVSRPGHFAGVATVVAKLFNIVRPHVAYFGTKDYQQLLVVRRMVEDLCYDLEVVGVPTVREPDGLALSSRNAFLTPDERRRAPVLYQTLCWLAEQLRSGRRDFSALEEEGRKRIAAAGFRPDYLAVVGAQTLAPPSPGERELVVLGAMYAEAARLIDNLPVQVGD